MKLTRQVIRVMSKIGACICGLKNVMNFLIVL